MIAAELIEAEAKLKSSGQTAECARLGCDQNGSVSVWASNVGNETCFLCQKHADEDALARC